MDDLLSTREVAWVLGRSPGSVRDMIRDGEIKGVRLPGGFRIPKAEALRIARERIKAQVGRTLTDSKLERLIDDVISTNARLEEHLRLPAAERSGTQVSRSVRARRQGSLAWSWPDSGRNPARSRPHVPTRRPSRRR